jgi:hypothetical protein
MRGEPLATQWLLARHGRNYNEQTKQAFHDLAGWRSAFAAFHDTPFRRNVFKLFPTRAILKRWIKDHANEVLDNIDHALLTGDASYFRHMATAIEAMHRASSGDHEDRFRHFMIWMSFDWPYKDRVQVGRLSASRFRTIYRRTTGQDVTLQHVRDSARDLGVVLSKGNYGPRRNSQR